MCQKNPNFTHPKYKYSKVEEVSWKEEGKSVSVRERVEQMEWSESSSRQVESVGVSECQSRPKCKTNSLLSLKHPLNFKMKPVRRPANKFKLPKQSESQLQSNINFWENWGVVKKRSNSNSS